MITETDSKSAQNYERMFRAAIMQLAELSDALGLSDDEKLCGGNLYMLEKIAELRSVAEPDKERDAMKLALDLIAAGVARIVPGNEEDGGYIVIGGIGPTKVGGDIYAIYDTWAATINAIGWDRAREALAERGSV